MWQLPKNTVHINLTSGTSPTLTCQQTAHTPSCSLHPKHKLIRVHINTGAANFGGLEILSVVTLLYHSHGEEASVGSSDTRCAGRWHLSSRRAAVLTAAQPAVNCSAPFTGKKRENKEGGREDGRGGVE